MASQDLDWPKVLAFLKANNYSAIKRICDCDKARPGVIPGYKGYLDLACLNCCKYCPRCKETSSDLDYPDDKHGGVCYGCYCGDNYSQSSDDHSDADSRTDLHSGPNS